MSDHQNSYPSGQEPSSLDDAQKTRDALAYVCANFEELREDLRSISPGHSGESALLSVLTRAGSSPADIHLAYAEHLDAIDAALLKGGDVLGLYGRAALGERSLNPPGIDKPPPPRDHETVYLCPDGACSRYALADEIPHPSCALNGLPLREDHL